MKIAVPKFMWNCMFMKYPQSPINMWYSFDCGGVSAEYIHLKLYVNSTIKTKTG